MPPYPGCDSGWFGMDFTTTAPSVVKSIKQRDLLNTWLRLYSDHGGPPPYRDFRPGRIEDELLDMMVFNVVGQGADARFGIVHAGSRLTTIYGNDRPRTEDERRFLDTAIGPVRYAAVYPKYRVCIDNLRPVYSISRVFDSNGTEVSYERLLLPFGSAQRIEHIVGSYKSISLDGRFQFSNLMGPDTRPPIPVLRAIIDPNLHKPSHPQERPTSDDIVDA